MDYSPQKTGESLADYTKRMGTVFTDNDQTVINAGVSTPVITTDSLKQQTPLPFVNPNQQTMFTGIPKLSEEQTQEQTLTPFQQSIQKSWEQLTTPGSAYDVSGKSTFQNTQNEAQDIAGKTKLVNDLTASFNDLSRQSIEIAKNVENTTSGLPITDRAQQGMTNKFKSENALQMNRLASQIETAKGYLTYAQSLADQAVKSKYDPIEDRRNTLIENLNILMKSPQATLDEKNQAQKQLDIQNAQKEKDAQDKQNMADVLDITNKAIANGLTDATIIQQLNKATTPQQANAIVVASGFGTKPTDNWSEPYSLGGNIVQKNTTTGEIRTAVNVPVTKATSEQPLGILDVQRYNELYPQAGVVAGDTEAQANAKIASINTPEAKTRSLVVAAQANGATYDTVVSEINKDTTIADKPTALKIAQEVYGVAQTTPTTPQYGQNNFAKVEIKDRITQLQGMGITGGSLKTQLKKDGYSLDAISNAGVGNIIDKFTSFLFGE